MNPSNENRPLRIAHIVRRFVFEEWGGIESVVWNTVRDQRVKGHVPAIFATSALRREGAGVWERDGIEIHSLDYEYPYFPMNPRDRGTLDKKGGNPYVPGLEQALREFRPDVVHIYCGGRLAAAAIKVAKSLGGASVMILQGGDASVPKEELDKMLRPLKGKFPWGGIVDRLRGLRFNPVSRADAVLSLSNGECDKLRTEYPQGDIRYFPNGVEAPKVRRTPGEFKGRLLCVARIDYQKNQKLIVELLAACPGTTARLIGPVTSDWYRDEIVARAKELGVADRLTIIEGLPHGSAELEKEFAQADAFVLPSVHEPFGIVALEAWTHGLPLLASSVGGLKDFIRDGEHGLLFASEDSAALVAAYRRLAGSRELREHLVAQAYRDVGAYTWPVIGDRLIGIYRELLAKKTR